MMVMAMIIMIAPVTSIRGLLAQKVAAPFHQSGVGFEEIRQRRPYYRQHSYQNTDPVASYRFTYLSYVSTANTHVLILQIYRLTESPRLGS